MAAALRRQPRPKGVEAAVAAEIQRAIAAAIVRVEVELIGLQTMRLAQQLARALRGSRRTRPLFVLSHRRPAASDSMPYTTWLGMFAVADWLSKRTGSGRSELPITRSRPPPAVPTHTVPSAIHVQRIDGVIAQAARIAVVAAIVMEAAGAPLEQIETAADRADPEIAVQVFGDGARARTAERAGIASRMRIARELAGLALDASEAAAERADPQVAIAVFVQAHDAVRRQRGRVVGRVAIGANEPRAGSNRASPPAIVPIHSAPCAIVEQRHDAIVGETQRPEAVAP